MKNLKETDLGKKNNIMYILFFTVFVMVLGFISFIELMKYYTGAGSEVVNWASGHENGFENDISNTFPGQFEFVNLNGFMAGLMGAHELNDVVRMENGYLTVPTPYFDGDNIEANSDMIGAFNDHLASKGIPVIFVITPNTNSKYDPQMPDYYKDHGNDNLDRIGTALKDRGVTVMDLRDELESDGISSYDMMYRTDHHWTTGMGFYAYCKIADMLEEGLNCSIDPIVKDINNYTVKKYKKWHLGSRGQRVGKYFGGIDDFDLITPNFETCVRSAEGDREGTYEDILINRKWLGEKDLTIMRDDTARRSIYDWVLEDSQGDYINDLSANDKKILILSDSFGKAVCPFLDISFARTKWQYGPVNEELIDEYDPDAVIMLYDISEDFSEDTFNYGWALTK